MELASPLSALIKTAPGAEPQGAPAAFSAQSGEISQDVFAAMLARQMGAGPPAQDLPAGWQDLLAQADTGGDPVAQLLLDQPPQWQAMPGMMAGMAPVSVTIETRVLPEALAMAGKSAVLAADVGKSDSPDVGAAEAKPGGDILAAENGRSVRQAVADAPASFAATMAAAKSVTEPLRISEMRVEQPLPAPAAGSMPQHVSAATVVPGMAVHVPESAAGGVSTQPVAGAIPQPVSSAAWGDSLGQRVVWMVGQQHQGVELHLNPPALGPLEVRLSMSDNQASLTFTTQHVPVREAIEAATSRLREMLAESGVSLGSVSVNVGQFTQQQDGQQAMADERSRGPAWATGLDGDQSLPAGLVTPLRSNGMVDLFA